MKVSAELDRLVDVLARDAVTAMAPGVISRVRIAGTLGEMQMEPYRVASAAASHPAYREALEAVASDDALIRIVPTPGAGPLIMAVDHTQGRVLREELIAVMIGSASAELRCLAIAPSENALAGAALRNLERLRRIGRGDATSVVTFFGFSGLLIEPNEALDLVWGKLTPAVGWYDIGEMLETRPTSSVLAAEHEIAISIVERSQVVSGSHPVFHKHQAWAQLTTRLLRLAVVLGTSPEHVAPVPTFEVTILPYELPSASTTRLVLAPPPVERKLTAAEGRRIERWALLLDSAYGPLLEVASRRITAAFSHRIDPADRLIDAVTAWESLFSANQDASLRITGAIAWLLEPDDPSARDVLHRELTRIYNLRSDVVHGRMAKPATLYNLSIRATELAVAALAALLDRRPELIQVQAKDRSRRLLMGLK